MTKTRSLSMIQPTGDPHLGNFLGAIGRWVVEQDTYETFFAVADLHAMTSSAGAATLASDTRTTAQILLAAGLDDRTTLFAQSHVDGHADLAWILGCSAKFGELNRMTQFKDKASKGQEGDANLGLFSYPVLMAADILIYNAERVPVGEDQRQHVELCRDVAGRFNHEFGDTFLVPASIIPTVAAKIYDLEDPASKMSKSKGVNGGTIFLLDSPDDISRKIRRAVTDSEGTVRYDPDSKPGVSNLLALISACSDAGTPEECASGLANYGALKEAAAEAVINTLRPLQTRFEELDKDPEVVTDALRTGRDKARPIAADTLERARRARGLLL